MENYFFSSKVIFYTFSKPNLLFGRDVKDKIELVQLSGETRSQRVVILPLLSQSKAHLKKQKQKQKSDSE